MDIKVSFYKCEISSDKIEVVNEFIKFLQKKFPLEDPVQIVFTGIRYGKMTTGSRTDNHILKILSADRMLIDILRTLSHEWVHEYQYQIMNWDRGPDIGGKNENHANIEAGILMKIFQKEYPDYQEILYNGHIKHNENN
jgi:hypothetical protein